MLRSTALTLLCIPAPSLAAAADAPAIPLFEKDVLPVFQAKCLSCHGADKQKADLDMRSKAAMLKGGEAGPPSRPAPRQKLIWDKIAGDKMPPGKQKLTRRRKDTRFAPGSTAARRTPASLPRTSATTARSSVTDADRQFWAFRPPARPRVPAVQQRRTRVRNPIDAFLLAALEKQGLSLVAGGGPADAAAPRLARPDRPAAHAARGRRVPRRPVARRLRDAGRPPAGEPRYGERWGRHWLDLAGYADSEGILDADYVRTAAWRYRDYVIRAFNKDKPYDRFLKEQIAGDELVDYWTAYRTQKELPAEVVEALTATGYLRCASDTSRPDFVNIKNAPGYYYQTLDDTVKIVASSTMGLTVQCAKCHSHKYDPIPQTDYYRMQAVFMSALSSGAVGAAGAAPAARGDRGAGEGSRRPTTPPSATPSPCFSKQLDEINKQFGERLLRRAAGQLARGDPRGCPHGARDRSGASGPRCRNTSPASSRRTCARRRRARDVC